MKGVFMRRMLTRYFLSACCTIFAIFLLMSLISFSYTDQTVLHIHNGTAHVTNYGGFLGATIAAFFLYCLGSAALLVVPFMIIIGLKLFDKGGMTRARIGAFVVIIAMFSTILYAMSYDFYAVLPGGILGEAIYNGLARLVDRPLIPLVIGAFLWGASIIFLQFWWARFVAAGFVGVFSYIWNVSLIRFTRKKIYHMYIVIRNKTSYTRAPSAEKTIEEIVDTIVHEYAPASELPISVLPELPTSQTTENVPSFVQVLEKPFVLPPPSLFKYAKNQTIDREYQKECRARAGILENKLERFGLMGSIVSITIGPVVTLYEYQPEIDVKVSKIVALEDDLALALEAHSLRIIAPVPGKSVIGFEVAYGRRMPVLFSSLITSKQYKQIDAALPLILGQNTVGDPVIIDLVSLPHLLVAGATGSGKSVALHTILMSLLCAKTPDELKLVIIDPKRLEFTAYADCPHLLFPIIVDAAKAVAACNYLVGLMEERYTQMAAAGVRTIHDYNKLNPDACMPYVAIIVDELADLMMTASKEIESVLARLAQMARAAGIHLIVATQRPSVDVITGLIKANFPARIAFKVASKIDSRTILDIQGAEKLLGKGDMLFLNGQGIVMRAHGAFLTEEEIETVVASLKRQRTPSYIDLSKSTTPVHIDPEDSALYKDIINFLETIDDVSISLLQRQFRIGYNRSARIIQQLESEGRIMTIDGGKTRRVVK